MLDHVSAKGSIGRLLLRFGSVLPVARAPRVLRPNKRLNEAPVPYFILAFRPTKSHLLDRRDGHALRYLLLTKLFAVVAVVELLDHSDEHLAHVGRLLVESRTDGFTIHKVVRKSGSVCSCEVDELLAQSVHGLDERVELLPQLLVSVQRRLDLRRHHSEAVLQLLRRVERQVEQFHQCRINEL